MEVWVYPLLPSTLLAETNLGMPLLSIICAGPGYRKKSPHIIYIPGTVQRNSPGGTLKKIKGMVTPPLVGGRVIRFPLAGWLRYGYRSHLT